MALLKKKKSQPTPAPKAPPTLEERLERAIDGVDSAVNLAFLAVGTLGEASAGLREVSREAQAEAARLAGIAQRALVEAESATRSADAVKAVLDER